MLLLFIYYISPFFFLYSERLSDRLVGPAFLGPVDKLLLAGLVGLLLEVVAGGATFTVAEVAEELLLKTEATSMEMSKL